MLVAIIIIALIIIKIGVDKNEAIKDEEASKGQLRYVSNMTEPKGLTYSIRGVSKGSRRHKDIVRGVEAWNKSKEIEFKGEVSAEEGYKKGNNHIFIDVVKVSSPGVMGNLRASGMSSPYKITIYVENSEWMSSKVYSNLITHEVAHVLGIRDRYDRVRKEDTRLMSLNLTEGTKIDKEVLGLIRYRYSKEGERYYNIKRGKFKEGEIGEGRGYTWDKDNKEWFKKAYMNLNVTDYELIKRPS